MAEELRWGIISTGGIAHTFARGLAHSSTGQLLAVGSRCQETAAKFGREFGVPRCYGSYEALLADREVEAVYIATPHPMHAEWAIKAAEARKHILCEKPLSINHAEAMAVVEAAQRNDVFLMEAFMYRCHPQTAELLRLIRSKAIGEVRVIQATFGFHSGWSETGRLLNNALGGGGILDVGCYCTSMSRLIAGAATGKDFAEPIDVKGCARIGKTDVDEWAIASLRFPGDIVAQLATGVQVSLENVVRVFGSEGYILVPQPWIPSTEGGTTKIVLHRKGEKEPQEIPVATDRWLYSIEADTVAANIGKRQAPPPAMTWADTLGNLKTLDRWRESVGLVYEAEKPEAFRLTVAKRPLRTRSDHFMKYGVIPGIGKKISRLFMGVDNQPTIAHATVMFDDFVENGGNAFDTAYIYGGGRSEKLLGQWVNNRDIRESVVILGKGAHTPYCNPVDLTRQLLDSLDRLQTGYVDIYMLHRDNPDVPVGEFVDVLNEHVKAGRIRAFGGSNWGIVRVEAANAYARSNGLQGFAAISNNFSLARMVAPVWEGCIAASDPDFRAWLTKTQMPVIGWSSQARGFFTDRARPDDVSDPELARCWYSEDNFGRQERAKKMARKKHVLPINIALAYVLCQPFPIFAIIGPRTLEETRTSLPALHVELTPEELKWLNLEEAPAPGR
jgi:predicted dehydrogenase/aryl-alcohol dehydrogenase-like predicted oxidoreductase